MIVLLSVWTSDENVEGADWAVVSLTPGLVKLYLIRLSQVEEMARESPDFIGTEFRSVGPVWEGYCEQWEDLYRSEVNLLDYLQPGEHSSIPTECNTMVVTKWGVEWHASIEDTRVAMETATLTREWLENALRLIKEAM